MGISLTTNLQFKADKKQECLTVEEVLPFQAPSTPCGPRQQKFVNLVTLQRFIFFFFFGPSKYHFILL